MKNFIKPQFLAASLGLLGLFACDISDSTVTVQDQGLTTIAPRIVGVNGAPVKKTGYVRIGITIPSTGLTRDTIYPFAERRGRITGVPVGASMQISVVGFDSIVNSSGLPEVVNRWSGVTSATAKAVTADMDSATVAATQPAVVAQAPVEVPVNLATVPTVLAASGGIVTLPTASEVGVSSSQEYLYAVDAGDEGKIVSVSAGSPKVPDDGKVPVSATSWVKVRVFVRDAASGLMIGTDGDSVLVHVPPPVPSLTGVVAGNAQATVQWDALAAGRINLQYKQDLDTAWTSSLVDGSTGSATIAGLVNGQTLSVKLSTVWGPKEGRDSSSNTAVSTAVPTPSVPMQFGAGTWYTLYQSERDTFFVGQITQATWSLNADSSYERNSLTYYADWKAKSWLLQSYIVSGGHPRETANWSIQGGVLQLRNRKCGYQLDGNFVEFTDSARKANCKDTASYAVTSLGQGHYAIKNPRNKFPDTLAYLAIPNPAWHFADDTSAPVLQVSPGVTDTIWASEGEKVTVRFDFKDLGSGVDSIQTDTGHGIVSSKSWGTRQYRTRATFFASTWTIKSSMASQYHLTVKAWDGAGNLLMKTFYFAVKPSAVAPDWVRSAPLKDTTWIKSGTVTLSGTASPRFTSLYLDSLSSPVAKDTAGNVSVLISAKTNLRRVLYGVDDSNKTVALDTFWLIADAVGPVVTWTNPVNGIDSTLPTGTTQRLVTVKVTDAGSGVASVTIGTLSLKRDTGSSWSGAVTGLKSGTNNLILTSTDNVGNIKTSSLSLTVASAAKPSIAFKSATNGDTMLVAGNAIGAALQFVVRDLGGKTVSSFEIDSAPVTTSDSVYKKTLAGLIAGGTKKVTVTAMLSGDTVPLTKSFYVSKEALVASANLTMGSELATAGSFLSIQKGTVLTTSQASFVDTSTGMDSWDKVDVVFRTDNANLTSARLVSPDMTISSSLNVNSTNFVEIPGKGSTIISQAALQAAFNAGTTSTKVTATTGKFFVAGLSDGTYALIEIVSVGYAADKNGTMVVKVSK